LQKKKNRLAEARQKDVSTSQSMMLQYRQNKKKTGETSPLPYKYSRQIMLKILSKRQNTMKKEV